MTLNEWTNWLQQESNKSEIEDELFLKNPEYKDWKLRFFKYSDGNDYMTFEQAMALEENFWKKYVVGELLDLSSKYFILIQFRKMNMDHLLNRPYVNEVTLTEQNPC